MCFFKYYRGHCVRKQNNDSHLFSPEKAQKSGPVSCRSNTWMDLAVHLMSQSLRAGTCKIRRR